MSAVLGKYMDDYTQNKIPHRLGPLDKAGIPLFDLRRIRVKGEPTYQPVVIIQYALAHYDLALAGNTESEGVFMRCVQWLEDNAVQDRQDRFLVWPYNFALRTPPVAAPWISGMAQGQALSVLARSFQKTGSSKTADVAQRAARSFLFAVEEGGVISRFSDDTYFIEEVACRPALHILNGCLYGLCGVVEYLSLFPDAKLKAVLDACIQGIEMLLPEYDTGYWSRYSLGIRWHLASIRYHKTHIRQLRYLASILQRPAFSIVADRWENYERSRINRLSHDVVEFLQINANRAMTLMQMNPLKYRRVDRVKILGHCGQR